MRDKQILGGYQKDTKTIVFYSKKNLKIYDYCEDVSIDMKELQAINKKCEEWRWNNERNNF